MKKNEIQNTLAELNKNGKRIFATSSFQTQSVPLLHIISELPFSIPVYFANTGFLFSETLQFKSDLEELLDLNVNELVPAVSKIHQLNSDRNFLYTSDPKRCCEINKVEPVNKLMGQYDVWISGVRADQTKHRKNLKTFESTPEGCQRFHPMLDWSQSEIESYISEYQLPSHPLKSKGYQSIGCQPCTMQTGDRSGRWSGLQKTECGLHTNLTFNSSSKSTGTN